MISSLEGWAPQYTQLGIIGISRQHALLFSFPLLFCLGLLFSLRSPCYNEPCIFFHGRSLGTPCLDQKDVLSIAVHGLVVLVASPIVPEEVIHQLAISVGKRGYNCCIFSQEKLHWEDLDFILFNPVHIALIHTR